MRLTGGEGKGRRLLDAPDHVRPTSGRIREQLFFMLRDRLEGARVLDLYAGTGALGLEAIARGAERVTYVDKDRGSNRIIKDNLERCKFTDRANIVPGDVFRKLRQPFQLRGPFDLIFADPPYDDFSLTALLDLIHEMELLKADGLFIYETRPQEDWKDVEGWSVVDQRVVGGTKLYFCELKNHSEHDQA
jgi:16S rRNA (guanine966-N2)-methyltransferase